MLCCKARLCYEPSPLTWTNTWIDHQRCGTSVCSIVWPSRWDVSMSKSFWHLATEHFGVELLGRQCGHARWAPRTNLSGFLLSKQDEADWRSRMIALLLEGSNGCLKKQSWPWRWFTFAWCQGSGWAFKSSVCQRNKTFFFQRERNREITEGKRDQRHQSIII